MPRSESAAPPLPYAPPRATAACAAAAPGVTHDEDEEPPDSDPASIAERLRSAVARVLPAIEAILGTLGAGHTPPRDMERTARALSALTRTLRELNALLKQHHVPVEEDSEEELQAFRRELARRIAALSARREAQDGAEVEEAASGTETETIHAVNTRGEARPSVRQI